MDVDIDIPPSVDITKVLGGSIRASVVRDGTFSAHPCGYYFQDIPVRMDNNGNYLAAFPYAEAEDMGYFKIDFLNLHLLEGLKDKALIRELIKIEPDWDLLLDDEIIPQLFQLSKWGDLLKDIKPRNIQELADCLALIRPGKINLSKHYRDKTEWVRSVLYEDLDDSKYSFKYSHAIAYAHNIVLQLHILGNT